MVLPEMVTIEKVNGAHSCPYILCVAKEGVLCEMFSLSTGETEYIPFIYRTDRLQSHFTGPIASSSLSQNRENTWDALSQ